MKKSKFILSLALTSLLFFGMVSPAHAVSQLWFLDRAALIQRLIDLGYITPPPQPEIEMMNYVGGFQGGEVVVDVKAKDGENAVHFTRPHPRDLPEGAEFIAYRDENNVLNGRIIWKSEDAAIGKMTIPVAVSDGSQSVTEDVVIRIHEAVEDEQPSVYIQNVDYTATGQIDLIEYGNGVTTDYEYSPLTLRLERIHTFNNHGDVLQDLHYSYDPVGNIVTIEDRVHSANQAFAYDEQSRLVRAEGESYGIKTYAYDAIGNIIEKDGLTYTYGENGAGVHAVTSLSDGTTFGYDANGNMLTEREPDGSLTEFDYDAENRLTAVTKNGFKTATYTYDGDGGRTSKTVNGVMTKYIGSLYEETGERQTQHIFLGSTRIASVTDGEAVYHHTDHLGGANVISDENGMVQELIEYVPFGDFARHEKYGDGEEIAWHYFTGQHYDKETELYFYNARYYNPKLGRFIQADTIVPYPDDPQSLNRYTYVRNNPIIFVDPSGHIFGAIWAIATFVMKHMVTGAVIGALVGGTVSVAMGGNFADGAISGAISGAIFGGIGGFGLEGAAQTLAHAAGGLASGGINAVRTGGDPVKAALIGGASAGLANGLSGINPLSGSESEFAQLSGEFVTRAVVGGAIGGVSSELSGGVFADGFEAGFYTAAVAYVANHLNPVHRERADTKKNESKPLTAGDIANNFDQGKYRVLGIIKGLEKSTGANFKTMAIGAAAMGAGASIAAGSLVLGGAATTSTGGLAFSVGVYKAGQGVVAGITLFSLGVGDFANGIYGNDSVIVQHVEQILNAPSESTVANPF